MKDEYNVKDRQDMNQQYLRYADDVLAEHGKDDSVARCIISLCNRIKELEATLKDYQDLDALLCK